MKLTSPRRAGIAASMATCALALAACGGNGGDTGGGGGGGGGGEATACEPAGEAVTLDFVSWVPGIGDAVDLWNEQNPDIQVELTTGPAGNAGTYQNYFNALEAGNAPDLAQIEYDSLPNFRVQGGLTDIGACEGVSAASGDFIDWTWQQVTFAEEGSVFAIPQDTGPMAMFYRSDLFEQAGIAPPTTWDEYYAAAQQIREQGGYITHFPQRDVNWFAGLVWQNDGQWFANDGEAWEVTLTSEESTEVAEYWQRMIDEGLVAPYQGFSPEFNAALDSGELWTWVSAVWGSNTIETNAPSTAGNWSVAQMPQWGDGGESAAGNWGGSSTAVLTDSEHPYEASQFALWLNTDPEALTILNTGGGLYPATTAGLELPSLQEGQEFFGGEPIFDVFAEASQNVDPGFVWGPTMTQTYSDVGDGFGQALSGQGTLSEALESGEQATIETLQSQSIPVAE